MSGHEDDGTCDRCGKTVHLLHDPPCPHGICVCDTCERADVCPDCKREDERDASFARCMAETGWTPHDIDLPTSPDPVAVDGGYFWDGSWVPAGPNPKERQA